MRCKSFGTGVVTTCKVSGAWSLNLDDPGTEISKLASAEWSRYCVFQADNGYAIQRTLSIRTVHGLLRKRAEVLCFMELPRTRNELFGVISGSSIGKSDESAEFIFQLWSTQRVSWVTFGFID
ncbi:hypothetical protein D3C81_1455990 [compost metagenome]